MVAVKGTTLGWADYLRVAMVLLGRTKGLGNRQGRTKRARAHRQDRGRFLGRHRQPKESNEFQVEIRQSEIASADIQALLPRVTSLSPRMWGKGDEHLISTTSRGSPSSLWLSSSHRAPSSRRGMTPSRDKQPCQYIPVALAHIVDYSDPFDPSLT